MTFASRPATKENLRLRNDSSNEFLTRANVNQQRVSHSFRRAPRSFQIRGPTSLTLIPTSSALVPDTRSNESHTHSDELRARSRYAVQRVSHSCRRASRSFQILTVAIDRGQATTVLSEHHNKEQRKELNGAPLPCLPCSCSVSCAQSVLLDSKRLCIT